MSFAADIKDFSTGFATGWKLMTPTAAEVRERENQEVAKERAEFRRQAAGGNTRRSGGGPDEDTSAPDSVTPRYNVSGKVPSLADLSPEQFDYTVRTVYGEAANQGDEGQKGVAAVIKHRVAAAGTDPKTEVLKPGQFEPWMTRASRQRMLALDPSSPTYQRIADNVKKVWEGGEDPTGGATHFFAPGAQAKLGRSVPSWATGKPTKIGDHLFYRLPYSGSGRHGTAPRQAVPMPPARPVTTTPASAVAIPSDVQSTAVDSATGLPIPAGDPRLDTSAIDRANGRRSALELTPGVNDDELMYPQYAARGGLVVPENASDATDDASEEADMKYLYGADSGDYASGRSSGYGARELVDRGTIPKMISDGMDYLTQKFGLTSGAIPAESAQAQRGVQAFAAGAGTPSHEEVDQIMQTVDPNGSLPKEQRHVVGWGNLYHYFSDRGDFQGAARASAAMLMYSKNVSRQAGTIAMAALEKGDFKRASDAVAAAYDYLPDGKALKVKNVGPGGIEYETVDVDGKRVEKGKIKREELADIAKGMVDGTLWFQSVNAASLPADKAAQRKAGESKVIEQFEEGIPEDTRGVEDLPAAQRKLWSQLPSTYRREQERKWRDLKKQDKTEGEAGAEEAFYSDPEVRDQFRATLSDDKLKQFENMSDKAKTNAIARFEKKRTQDFNEFKFDDRMRVNAENRDRAEALKLFGMSQRYGMWQATREQIMTENERRAAQRQLEEEGRGKRQELSIAQQNKVQENIDRRILEKRTATLDGAGQRLTPVEARERRRLGGIDADEEARLQSLDEQVITAGPEATPDEQAAAREKMAGKVRAGAGFNRLGKGQMQEMTDENRSAISARIDENLKEQKNSGVKEWASRIAQDVYRGDPQRTEQQAADIVTQSIFHPQEPKVFPGGLVQLVPGLPPVRMSEESMAALVTQRELAKRGAAKPPGAAATATGDEFQSPAARRIAAERAATSQRGLESRTALNLEAAARERPGGDIYEGLKSQLGADWQQGMTIPQMRQALQDLENERAYGGKRARARRAFEATRSAVDLLPQR
jgi:hypothetical protein